MKRCKNCGDRFTPIRSTLEKYCLKPGCIDILIQEAKKKAWDKKKKEMKAKLETPSDHRNKLQEIFNKWIRLRDKDLPCISCARNMKDKKIHAGHFYSVGQFPELRFDEDNVHGQCEWCNIYLHGNGALYRMNLEKKIGSERLKLLDDRAGVPKNYLKHEIISMTETYKIRVKEEKSKK
jgi:predicted  nucleic acid-binding Zn-ribbon protein